MSGAGFAANSTGAGLECNNVPGQPTSPCSGTRSGFVHKPLTGFTPRRRRQPAGASFTVGHRGTDRQAPEPTQAVKRRDRCGKLSVSSTPAQISAGDSCVISFGDQAGDQVTFPISFSTGSITTSSTTGKARLRRRWYDNYHPAVRRQPRQVRRAQAQPVATTGQLPGILDRRGWSVHDDPGPGIKPGEIGHGRDPLDRHSSLGPLLRTPLA